MPSRSKSPSTHRRDKRPRRRVALKSGSVMAPHGFGEEPPSTTSPPDGEGGGDAHHLEHSSSMRLRNNPRVAKTPSSSSSNSRRQAEIDTLRLPDWTSKKLTEIIQPQRTKGDSGEDRRRPGHSSRHHSRPHGHKHAHSSSRHSHGRHSRLDEMQRIVVERKETMEARRTELATSIKEIQDFLAEHSGMVTHHTTSMEDKHRQAHAGTLACACVLHFVLCVAYASLRRQVVSRVRVAF